MGEGSSKKFSGGPPRSPIMGNSSEGRTISMTSTWVGGSFYRNGGNKHLLHTMLCL